jgi:DNA-binding transcriptional MerR regulator
MEYLNERFYETGELLKIIGNGLTKDMLAYLRDVLHLIPSPIKMGTGRGTKAYYSESSLKHLKRIMKERKKGLTYKQIKEKLKEETTKVFARSDYLRRQFQAERNSKMQLGRYLIAGSHPDSILKIKNRDNEVKIQRIKRELKEKFEQWNGNIEALNKIRCLIDELERLTVTQRVSKQISQVMIL